MNVVQLAFYLVALILLILAAIGVPGGRYGLGWAGLAFWITAEHILTLLG